MKPEVRRTEGDFPHVKKRSVILACGCSTCCCLTFLGAGIGGISGMVVGLASRTRTRHESANDAGAIFATIGWKLLKMVVYGIAGLLIGAGLGFGADMILGSF